MQSLYSSFFENISEADESQGIKDYDKAKAEAIVEEILERQEQLDLFIDRFLRNGIDRLDKLNHAILLLACYELLEGEVDYKVAINESIKLGEQFGSKGVEKFLNGVTASMAKQLWKDGELPEGTPEPM